MRAGLARFAALAGVKCPSCGAGNAPGAEVCFECRTVLTAVTRGSVLSSRYEVLRLLGRGGMGAVYRARDRALREEVALKILRNDVAGSPDLAERFRSEVKLARRVSHPGVCRIYEYGEDGGLQYLAMELVDGVSLRRRLDERGPLDGETARVLMLELAEALAAIHQAGIIHRDLSASNVMLEPSGRARILDFGIAKRIAAHGTGRVTSPGYVLGSPEYMSPEQARNVPVDARSDLYSLGVVAYEALTGRVPFRGDSPVATLLMQLEAPPPLEGPGAEAIPPRLREMFRRLLAKDPAERYGQADELVAALREEPRAALPTTAPVERPARWSWGAAAAGAALVILVGLTTQLLRTAPEPAAPARDERAPVTRPPAASPTASPTPRPVETLEAGTPAETPEARAAPAAPHTEPTPAPIPTPTATPTPSDPPRELSTPPPGAPGVSADAEESDLRQPPGGAPTPPPEDPTPAPAPVSVTPAPPIPEESEAGAAADRGAEPAIDGWLLVLVEPWGEVTLDGEILGHTPLARMPLSPGVHDVVITHPDFRPWRRRVRIVAGETFEVAVDLATDAVRRDR